MDSKRTNVEAAMTINGLHTTERQAWRKKSEADAAWVETNGNLWRAIMTAMRDNGAWIGCAFDEEEGMVEATLYLDGKEICGASDVQDYSDWLAYSSDVAGYCEYRWDAERSPALLADLLPSPDDNEDND